MPQLDLLDAMMKSSTSSLRQEGNAVLEVGKARALVPGHPAFVIVSHTGDDGRIVTSWGTVTHDRNYSITSVTLDREGSDELAATVRRVIESFQALQ